MRGGGWGGGEEEDHINKNRYQAVERSLTNTVGNNIDRFCIHV